MNTSGLVSLGDPDPEYTLVVDRQLKQPAGMFIQLAYGGAVDLLDLFDTAAILTGPTKEMEIMRGTRAQWVKFAAQTNQRMREGM